MSESLLPAPNDPLVLADGSVINPVDGSVISAANKGMTEVPTDREAVRTVMSARRRIGDLPVPPQQMNVLSVILAYSLMGLTDEDIATCTGVPLDRVLAIKLTEAYTDIKDTLVQQLVISDQENVRTMLSESAVSAATKMTGLLNSDSEGVQLAAAKDILDRSGHRPADVVEHKHSVEGGLTIRYVKKADEREAFEGVTIDHGGLN